MNRARVAAVPAPGERVTLGEAESHHLLRVCRVARGAEVEIADGAGNRARARLVDGRERAVLEVEAPLPRREVPARVVLLGMPKAPAVEEALTLGAEAGMTRLVLVEAERTPPGRPRPDRLERVLAAALTQCGREDHPGVEGPVSLEDALAWAEGARFVATPGAAGGAVDEAAAATVAIGPEGGWSPREQAALEAAGFAPLGLGAFLLRTPTAVAVALGRLLPREPGG